MKHKRKSIFVLLLVLCGMGFAPAQGKTIKNGVQCIKLNSIAKSDSKVYRCGKNPFFKPTQLTWTLRGCFTAYALWNSSKKQYEDFKDIAKLAGAEGEKTMNDLLVSIASLEETMKNEACKKGA